MIYLATPIWRYYDVRAAHALTSAIAMNKTEEPIFWETIDGDALISRTRSQLATKFYEGIRHPKTEEQADVMVILDDDVQFDPRDLWKIVRQARERQEPVGGIYVTRSRKPHLASRLLPDHPITFGHAGLVPIQYLATGFMAIPWKCVDAIVTMGVSPGFTNHMGGTDFLSFCVLGTGELPMWDLFRPFVVREPDGRLHYLSEDWAFCERMRQAGFSIWADSSIILSHRAYVSITVHDLPQASDGRNMLGDEGAPAKASSTLFVDEHGGDDEEAGSSVEQMTAASQ